MRKTTNILSAAVYPVFAAVAASFPKPKSRVFQRFNIAVENPAGSVRRGTDEDGKPWQTKMMFDYGYIRRTKGADNEGVDCYVGNNPTATHVHIVHQNNPVTGEYDEDKCMIGFPDAQAAQAAFMIHYDRPGFFGSLTSVPVSAFRSMITDNKNGGESLKFRSKPKYSDRESEQFSAEWHESDHPRGQPDNAGQFIDKDDAPEASEHPSNEDILRMIRERKRLQIIVDAMPKDGIPGSAAQRAWMQRAKLIRDKIAELTEKIGKRPEFWKPRPKTAADARMARLFKPAVAATRQMFETDVVCVGNALYRLTGESHVEFFEAESDGGRWITIGGQPGADGKKHGGSPVHIQVGGEIDKGPAQFKGQNVNKLTAPVASLKRKMALKSGQPSGLSEEEERHAFEVDRFNDARVSHVRSQLKDGRGVIKTNDPRMQVLVSQNIGPSKDRSPWRATYFHDGRPTSHQEYQHLDNPDAAASTSLVHDVSKSGVAFPVENYPEISESNPWLADEHKQQQTWKQQSAEKEAAQAEQQAQQQAAQQQQAAIAKRKETEPSAADYPANRAAEPFTHPKPKREEVIDAINKARQASGDAPVQADQKPQPLDSMESLRARIAELKKGGMRTDLAVAKARTEQSTKPTPGAAGGVKPPPPEQPTAPTNTPSDESPKAAPNVDAVPDQFKHLRERMQPGDVWDDQANQVGRRISRLMRDDNRLSFADAKKRAVGDARGLGIPEPVASGLFPPADQIPQQTQKPLFDGVSQTANTSKPASKTPAPEAKTPPTSNVSSESKSPTAKSGFDAEVADDSGGVPKDKPVTLVFGGSFSPVRHGHLKAARDAKKLMEDRGYKVGKVIVAPTADKLLKTKLGDDLVPLEHRTQMAKLAAQGDDSLEVSDEPAKEAENFPGKLRRTQLADWARRKYPDSTVVAVAGQDSAPGYSRESPPEAGTLYSGEQGSSHEGYHYMIAPRDEKSADNISSSQIRKHFADKGEVPDTMMHPEAAKYYKNYMQERAGQASGKPQDELSGKMDQIEKTLEKARAGQSDEPAAKHALDVKPSSIEPGTVKSMHVDDLHVDPERFQYKSGVDKAGVTNKLKNVKYDSELSGIMSVWQDPEDGKTYVVNGHHRHELAKRSGVGQVAVRYLKAKTAQEARTTGALINIAQGNGRGVDAAKLFRDTGLTAEDLKGRGVSLSHGLATTGLQLSKLHPDLFRKVVNGEVPEQRGASIAAAFDDHAQQKALVEMLDKQEKRGRAVTNEEIGDLARFIRSAGVREESGGGLFSDDQVRKSNAMEKARLSTWYKRQIRRDKKLFGTISRKSNVESLTEAGNKIDAERARGIADDAAAGEYVFDKLVDRKGPISDILNQHAERLAKGDSYDSVSKSLATELRSALPAALGGSKADTGTEKPDSGRSGGSAEGGPAADEQKPEPEDPSQVKMFSAGRSTPIRSIAQLIQRMKEVRHAA